jgi:NADPH:quinone reductase-like Zn-dependent oxidoreductase
MLAAVLSGPDTAPAASRFPDPPVADGSRLVTLVAAGIHPVVRQLASGAHYGSAGAWPQVPGVDAVARTGDGELVYTGYATHPYGTFAEKTAVPMTLPLPAGADPVQVAAALNPGLSSWLPLRAADATGGLGTVVVLGATGVAGRLAVRNAQLLGADHVIAVGRDRPALDALARDGGVTAVELRSDHGADVAALGEAFGPRRPGLVLDFVWGAPAEAAFEALGRSGLDEDTTPIAYVEIGQAAGPRAAVPAALLRSTAITVRGSGAGSSSMDVVMAELPVYLERIADGSVHVDVDVHPLEDVERAWTTPVPGRRTVVTGPAYAA